MIQTRRWSDLKPWQRIVFPLLGIVQVSLLVAALWDTRHRPEDQINGSKRMWMGLAFVNWIGPLSYFFFGRKR